MKQTRKLIFHIINYLQSLETINNRKSSHTFEEARIRNHQTIPGETKYLSKQISKKPHQRSKSSISHINSRFKGLTADIHPVPSSSEKLELKIKPISPMEQNIDQKNMLDPRSGSTFSINFRSRQRFIHPRHPSRSSPSRTRLSVDVENREREREHLDSRCTSREWRRGDGGGGGGCGRRNGKTREGAGVRWRNTKNASRFDTRERRCHDRRSHTRVHKGGTVGHARSPRRRKAVEKDGEGWKEEESRVLFPRLPPLVFTFFTRIVAVE